MKLHYAAALALLVAGGLCAVSPPDAAWARDKTAPKAKTHAESSETVKMTRLLDGTGYKYVKRKPSVWTIAFAGKRLGNSVVVVTMTPKLAVLFTIIGANAVTQKTPQLMQILLRANSTFDYCKVGFDHDGDLFVRLDAPMRVTDSRQLKTDLEQLMSASDELYGQVAQFIKR